MNGIDKKKKEIISGECTNRAYKQGLQTGIRRAGTD